MAEALEEDRAMEAPTHLTRIAAQAPTGGVNRVHNTVHPLSANPK